MKNRKQFNWKKYLTECLESTDYCCIATVDEKSGVWSNPVYFAWGNQFHLYFISQMYTRHMQNLKNNSRIAVSIYKTEQKGDVIGIQLEGSARILSEKDGNAEIQHAHDVYFGRAGYGPDVSEYLTNPSWLYVKITPNRMYYFDTRFFEEERQTVPLDKINL